MSNTHEIVKGISWIGALRASTRVIAFVRIGVLARILTPLEFGLYGIATLFLEFLETITETGINVFLVQEEGEMEEYLDTAWLVSILRGIFIALLIFGLSSSVASFFNSPGARTIVAYISLVPLIRGFINPAEVKFRKNLEFHKEFWFRFIIFAFDSSVAIVFGIITHQTTSLVWGLIAGAVLEVVLSFALIKPTPKIALDLGKITKVINRGKWVTAYGFFNYLFENGDDAVVGKLLNTGALGVYQMAYKISTLPITEVSQVFMNVTFPYYSKLTREKEELKSIFIKTISIISLLVIPFGLLIFFFSKQIVLIILGDKWLAAVPVLKILSVFGIVRAITHPCYSLFLAMKKQELITAATLVNIIVMAITLIPFIKAFSLMGAGYSVLLSAVITTPFVYYYVFKLLEGYGHDGL